MKTKKKNMLSFLIFISVIIALIGLTGCGTAELGVVNAESDIDGAIEVGIEPTPVPDTLSYTNSYYGFKFDYPETWNLIEIDHGVVLKKGNNRLGINFKWVGEEVDYGRTGFGGGTPIYSAKVHFMGEVIPQNNLVLDTLTKAVLFWPEGVEITPNDIVFSIVLEDLVTNYMELDLSDEVIAEAVTILESFEPITAEGSPDDESQPPPVSLIPIVDTSQHPDWLLYENREYGFAFLYPPYMEMAEEIHAVKLQLDSIVMTFAYRGADDDISLVEDGELVGQYYPHSEIFFLGQFFSVIKNIQDDEVRTVYLGGPGIELGKETPLIFTITVTSLDETEITDSLIDEMIRVLETFGSASLSD